MTTNRVYVVRLRPGDKDTNRRWRTVPFENFYIVPPGTTESQLRKLAPYTLVTPLIPVYKDILEATGVPVRLIDEGWMVVAPIQMKRIWVRGGANNEVEPTYITNKKWYGRKLDANIMEYFPEETMLVTPLKSFQPPCNSCAKNLSHIAGECKIGTLDCLNNIQVVFKPTPLEDEKEVTHESDHRRTA